MPFMISLIYQMTTHKQKLESAHIDNQVREITITNTKTRA
jgi:hypothetical protein